ncbi:TPA: hypothetical protein ROS15_005183 [Escherichia coli]|nr:hypothetical protein [Escherichia coli]EHR8814496.1 hypothetical protein [Escherichia coli]HAM5176192.1 hypothetical protein [Escherichia coli]HBA3039511.1 hypothetical protein [Escherichia coli]HCL7292400.1 hypothetical protein [Escherichia coli]
MPLHGTGCLPVNSVPAPESAIIPYTYSLITPPHRGIHHAKFFNKLPAGQTIIASLNYEQRGILRENCFLQ